MSSTFLRMREGKDLSTWPVEELLSGCSLFSDCCTAPRTWSGDSAGPHDSAAVRWAEGLKDSLFLKWTSNIVARWPGSDLHSLPPD